jgi:hypothetical protein
MDVTNLVHALTRVTNERRESASGPQRGLTAFVVAFVVLQTLRWTAARSTLRALRPPHGCRARMGPRSQFRYRAPGQRPRRSLGERLDSGRPEAGLEGYLPDCQEVKRR